MEKLNQRAESVVGALLVGTRFPVGDAVYAVVQVGSGVRSEGETIAPALCRATMPPDMSQAALEYRMIHNPAGLTRAGWEYIAESVSGVPVKLPDLLTQLEFAKSWGDGAIQLAVQLKLIEMTDQFREAAQQLESGPLLPGE